MATLLRQFPLEKNPVGVVAPRRSAEKVVERERPVHRPRGCRTGGSPQIETSFSLIASSPFFIRFFYRGSVTRSYAEIAHVTGIFLPRICILPRRAGAKIRNRISRTRENAFFHDFFDTLNFKGKIKFRQ